MTFEFELENILNRQRQQGYCSLDQQIDEIKKRIEKYYELSLTKEELNSWEREHLEKNTH